jgi:hypothetical protein
MNTARAFALEWLDRAFGYAVMRKDADPRDVRLMQTCAVMEGVSWTVAQQFLELTGDPHE